MTFCYIFASLSYSGNLAMLKLAFMIYFPAAFIRATDYFMCFWNSLCIGLSVLDPCLV